MTKQNQITKEQVHEIFRTSKNGDDIARAVAAYFRGNKEKDFIETANKIFNGPVNTPGPAVAFGQGVAAVPGLLTPPRTT